MSLISKSKYLKVVIYDKTDLLDEIKISDALATSWYLGARLYILVYGSYYSIGATNWHDAIEQVLKLKKKIAPDRPIDEIQFWGHGSPGVAYIGKHKLSLNTMFTPNLQSSLCYLSACLNRNALIWFRTCGTFCGVSGLDFAENFSDLMNCRVAGHTYNINFWHGGLHEVFSKVHPRFYRWPIEEGVLEGTPDKIIKVATSNIKTPNLITCLHTSLPKRYGWLAT